MLQPSSLVCSRLGARRPFLAARARAMARSACDTASAFVIAWPAARWSASRATDHFHTLRPRPCTTEYSMSRCFIIFRAVLFRADRADGEKNKENLGCPLGEG